MSEPAVDAGTGERTDVQPAVLRASNLEKRFGGIVAVDGVSFEIDRATITGLIGPNGAGKSTTFDLITGVTTPNAGRVYVDGEDVTGLRPDQLVDRGVIRTFQISRELGGMTVLENVLLAFGSQQGESLWRAVVPGLRRKTVSQERALLERAWETLELFELDHLAHEAASNLSGGQRKLLELARALQTEPEIVLLDEPMAGVNPTLEATLLERIHELRSQGYTFLLVEHDMEVVMNHCETVIVMHQGRILTRGTPEEIRADEQVIDAYLGGRG